MSTYNALLCWLSLICATHASLLFKTPQTKIRHLWHNKAAIYTAVTARTRQHAPFLKLTALCSH